MVDDLPPILDIIFKLQITNYHLVKKHSIYILKLAIKFECFPSSFYRAFTFYRDQCGLQSHDHPLYCTVVTVDRLIAVF